MILILFMEEPPYDEIKSKFDLGCNLIPVIVALMLFKCKILLDIAR
jgi:hypothetical protein